MAMKQSHLYILSYPEGGFIKIGKADNVLNRVRSLAPGLGKPDLGSAVVYSLPYKAVRSIEKSIHTLLSEYRFEHEVCDGWTELFRPEAMQRAVDIMTAAGYSKPISYAETNRVHLNEVEKYKRRVRKERGETIDQKVARINKEIRDEILAKHSSWAGFYSAVREYMETNPMAGRVR